MTLSRRPPCHSQAPTDHGVARVSAQSHRAKRPPGPSPTRHRGACSEDERGLDRLPPSAAPRGRAAGAGSRSAETHGAPSPTTRSVRTRVGANLRGHDQRSAAERPGSNPRAHLLTDAPRLVISLPAAAGSGGQRPRSMRHHRGPVVHKRRSAPRVPMKCQSGNDRGTGVRARRCGLSATRRNELDEPLPWRTGPVWMSSTSPRRLVTQDPPCTSGTPGTAWSG
jgi:hypothetical protein